MNTAKRRVMVTGVGIITAIGANFNDFWNCLLAGASGVKRISSFDASNLPMQTGAEITQFDVDGYFDTKESHRLSRISKLAVIAADEALASSGLKNGALEEAGTFVGCSQGGFIEAEYGLRSVLSEGRRVNPLTLLRGMNSGPATTLTIRRQMRGPSMTFDTACSSATHAIGNAARYIHTGDADVILAGGVDCMFSPYIYELWCTLRALSKRNESPETACRPFDVSRDGTVLGEGAGFFVLEAEESARRRDAHIFGEVLGYGSSSDAHHVTQPNIDGQLKAMRMALSDAGVCAEDVGYVHAHGTGTALNDEVEARAIQTIFGDARPMVAASKPATGHTLAASGVINAMICLGVMNSGCVPHTLNLENPIPEYDLDYVRGSNRAADVSISMCNSFSFGGSNAVLVLGQRMENE